MFGLIFLIVISILAVNAPDNQDEIQHLFDRFTCPMPEAGGLWNSSGTIIHGNGTYNWERDGSNGAQPPDTLTCTQVHTLQGVDYYYGQPAVAIGVFYFINDYVSEFIGNKGGAFFQLMAIVLTPAGFNLLGFTIADLSGVALMGVIGIYIMCYIAIGALIYKIISPFAGAS